MKLNVYMPSNQSDFFKALEKQASSQSHFHPSYGPLPISPGESYKPQGASVPDTASASPPVETDTETDAAEACSHSSLRTAFPLELRSVPRIRQACVTEQQRLVPAVHI